MGSELAAVLEVLRRLEANVDGLRRELADRFDDFDEKLARLELPRAAVSDAAAGPFIEATHKRFGEGPFLAVELMDWCRQCVDQAQRDAYLGIRTLCQDDNPTPLQAGKVLGSLAAAGAPGEWRVVRRGVRHNTAQWGVIPPSP